MLARATVLTALVLGLMASGCGSSHRLFRQSGLDVHTFTNDSVDTHLLVAGTGAVMVDPGYERNAGALDGELRAAGIDPAGVKVIVLTHGHADHAGAAGYFQKRYGARIVVGAADEGMLESGSNEPLCPTGLLGKLRYSTDQTATHTPFRADVQVTEPMDLGALSGVPGRIVPLASHTDGSLVVLSGDAAFVGDLFRGALVGSGAATHLYMCDVPGNRRSIHHLLQDLAPSAARFFVGHFGPVERADVVSAFDGD